MRKSIKTSFLSAVLCYNENNIKGLHEVQSQEVVIMTRGIRVKNTDDIQKINKIVTRYGFDIWIHGKSGMVDAKISTSFGKKSMEPSQKIKFLALHSVRRYIIIKNP